MCGACQWVAIRHRVRSELLHVDRQFGEQSLSMALSAPGSVLHVLLPRHSPDGGMVRLTIFLYAQNGSRPDSSNRLLVRKALVTNMGYWRTIAASTQGLSTTVIACTLGCQYCGGNGRLRDLLRSVALVVQPARALLHPSPVSAPTMSFRLAESSRSILLAMHSPGTPSCQSWRLPPTQDIAASGGTTRGSAPRRAAGSHFRRPIGQGGCACARTRFAFAPLGSRQLFVSRQPFGRCIVSPRCRQGTTSASRKSKMSYRSYHVFCHRRLSSRIVRATIFFSTSRAFLEISCAGQTGCL